MNDYVLAIVLVAAFVAGLAVGVAVTVYGLRLGFRASYQIRNDSDETPGLFAGQKAEPPELSLNEKET